MSKRQISNKVKIATEFEKEADVRTEIRGGKRDRDIDRQSGWQRGDSKRRRGRAEQRDKTAKNSSTRDSARENLVVLFVKTYAIFNRARVHRHDRFTQRCIHQNLSPKPTKSKDTFAL
jgi:hypothetical protein